MAAFAIHNHRHYCGIVVVEFVHAREQALFHERERLVGRRVACVQVRFHFLFVHVLPKPVGAQYKRVADLQRGVVYIAVGRNVVIRAEHARQLVLVLVGTNVAQGNASHFHGDLRKRMVLGLEMQLFVFEKVHARVAYMRDYGRVEICYDARHGGARRADFVVALLFVYHAVVRGLYVALAKLGLNRARGVELLYLRVRLDYLGGANTARYLAAVVRAEPVAHDEARAVVCDRQIQKVLIVFASALLAQ